MNYGYICVDGMSYNELKTQQHQTMITSGQLLIILNEINLQKQGYGVRLEYDKSISTEANYTRYVKFFDDYWNEDNWPGEPIKNKTK